MDDFNYGKNLRKIRQDKGISQEAMSLYMNISQTSYSRIESQTLPRDQNQVKELAKLLDVSPHDLAPNFEQLEAFDLRSYRGSGSLAKLSDFMKTTLGLIFFLAAAAILINVSYEFAKGFCAGLGLSTETMFIVAGIVALITTSLLVYLYLKIKRMS